jgi:hypothetical protein
MSRYHTDQYVREEIDRLLERNAKRQAALGIEDCLEMRVLKKSAAKDWGRDLIEISRLDLDFARVLEPQE